MLLLLDNFDSFTYNLVHLFAKLGETVKVVRNQTTIADCLQSRPSALIIGPGPGAPTAAGISKDLIAHCAGLLPILGVCLGHQCLAEVYGGATIRAKKPIHGIASQISHQGKGIFSNIPQGFRAMRYHSLIVEKSTLPSCLEITGESEGGEIMAMKHRTLPIESVQFHPESAGSEYGEQLVTNFLTTYLNRTARNLPCIPTFQPY